MDPWGARTSTCRPVSTGMLISIRSAQMGYRVAGQNADIGNWNEADA